MDKGKSKNHVLPRQIGEVPKSKQRVSDREQNGNQRKNDKNSSIKDSRFPEQSRENARFPKPADNPDRLRESEPSRHMPTPVLSQAPHYHCIAFGLNSSSPHRILDLFENLKRLDPMDKNGSMSGDCDYETTQMEDFLKEVFGFEKLRKKYIVQGVQAFKLNKRVETMHPSSVIYFPKRQRNSFAMTAEEIRHWQHSYAVYIDKDIPGMTKQFLLRALQGLSDSGKEAFLMKFVVRISQCPILMEFDAKIIPREPLETWPHNIKLVSVTGIDFAGRIHDVDDIRIYVSNWQEVYENDPRSNMPFVYNGRDFRRKYNSQKAELVEERVFNDLKRMARLRLRACDLEKVQVVVETGIGLGVFAGKYIGIDEKVRAFSAQAIRTVLEEEQGSFRNILAIVFALPIFEPISSNAQRHDTFYAFENEFRRYRGQIPVFIADQDMHRLTVAIARKGFIVSELNPADSHGVFGEYWQNRGPAVEEKLALTTVGLLVQHHLINPYVLNEEHYHLI